MNKDEEKIDVTNLKSVYGTNVVNSNPNTTLVRNMFGILKQLVFKHKLKKNKRFNYHLTKGQKNNITKINRLKTIKFRVRIQKKYAQR